MTNLFTLACGGMEMILVNNSITTSSEV